MPIKTFVDGDELPASDLNDYLMRQAVIVCTSTTRPSSPPVGMTIYETDTYRMLVYTSATTGWVRPWNVPWGVLGRASVGVDQTITASTDVDVSDTLITGIALPANRVVAMAFRCVLVGNSGTPNARLNLLYKPGSAAWQPLPHAIVLDSGGSAFGYTSVNHEYTFVTPSAATYQFKVTASNSGGSGSYDIAGGTANHQLVVEDMGAEGAPA